MARPIPDGLPDPEAKALTDRLFPGVVQNANKLSGASQALKQRWFGARWADVGRDLNRITSFLNGASNTVRFQKQGGAGNFGAVWRTVQAPYLKGAQKATAGSGVLVYLQDVYFTTTSDEKANTIFHELTHKLILTDDQLGYDSATLLAAARTNPAAAIKNAENWTQFYAEFVSGDRSVAGSGARPPAGSARPSPRALLGRCGGS